MNIKFFNNLVFDIYVKKYLIENIDFSIKSDIEKYLKRLFKTLNNKYNLEIEGFYDITVYIDKFYGVVLHIEKEETNYYDCYKNQVDMRLVTIDTNFIYRVDDIPFDILDKLNVKIKNNNIYVIIKKELTKFEMMNLLENSQLIYNN